MPDEQVARLNIAYLREKIANESDAAKRSLLERMLRDEEEKLQAIIASRKKS
jgi:bacterioferritin (cytochrome b1)